MGNKITKAVRSDKVEFRTGNTRPQPVPMSDIRGKAFSKVKTVQNCDKTAFRRELLNFFGVDIGLDSREIHPQKVCSACRRVVYHLNSGNLDPETSEGRKQGIKLFVWKEHSSNCYCLQNLKGRPSKKELKRRRLDSDTESGKESES